MDARVILGGLAIGAVLVAGCGRKETAVTASHEGGGTAAVAPAAKPQTTCPVMGGAINRSIHADYEGKRVYFCCNACVSTFKADPAKYIKKLEDAGVTIEKAPAGSAAESKAEGHEGMHEGGHE